MFWCEDCILGHNIIRANREHRVLALKDFKDQVIEDVIKRPAFCEKEHHENGELKFFCNDCKVPICNTCVVTLHECHSKVTLAEAANERKQRVKAVIESHKQEALQKRSKISKLQDERTKIQTQVTSVKRNAQIFADNMMKVIEAKKQEFFGKLEHKEKESVERLNKEQCEVENELQQIETAIEETEKLVNRSTSPEIVQLDTSSLESISNIGEQVECGFEDPDCLFFVENKNVTEKVSSEGVGSVKTFISKTKARQSIAEGKGISEATVGLEAQLALTTRNAEEEQCYEEFDCVIMETRNNQGDDCTTEVNVQDNKDGTYNISYFAKETGTCQVSVMVNGEHVRDSPFTVQFNTRQYRPVLSFGRLGSSAGMFKWPWGVTVNERNEIVVTDRENNRVQVFSVDGTYLRSFGWEGQQDGEFGGPSGIVFLNNGNIIVADSTSKRVQMFDGKGEYLRQFGDHQLNYSCGLSVDINGNIIVVDSSYKLIKIFSPSGQLLRKFGGVASLSHPCHCIQTGSNLIVSDKSSIGDGGSSAFLRNCAVTKAIPILLFHFMEN